MSEPLFEPISAEEFRRQTIRGTSKREVKTEPRMLTVWYDLPTTPGFCTIPDHNEVQQMLNPEAKEYRQRYPTRHVFEIQEGVFICRDCFMAGADKHDDQ